MTREEFIQVLRKKGYSYEIDGDKLVVYAKTVLGSAHNTFGSVNLEYLTTLPSDVVFKNEGDVFLESLVGGWFGSWEGNIDGIDSTRLLNLMISKGIFER